MNKPFKIYNFEFGTLTDEKSTVKIEMENSQFTYDNIDEIKELPIKKDSLFLDFKGIKESETTVSFLYEKGSVLKNLNTIKKEAYPVKVSIVEEILKQDILQKYSHTDLYISLNPATIYYYPMNTVRYTYAANRFMPRDMRTTLERYKACIVSILSGIAYEKCLNTPEEVRKVGNDFIKEIYQQRNVSELLSLIQQSNNFLTYDYIRSQTKREQKIRQKSLVTLAGASIVFLSISGLLLGKQSNQEEALASQYEAQLEQKDTLLLANEEFEKENYDEAIQLYQEGDYKDAQLSEKLLSKEQYQKAIDVHSESLEAIIQRLYETNEQQALVDLNSDSLDENGKTKLEEEKGIVQGDTNAMVNTLNFLTEESTGIRLARKFVDLNDVNNAQKVLDKYPENESLQKIVAIGQQIQEKTKQMNDSDDDKQRETLQKEIDGLKEQLEEYRG
ncbi:hypothetical protein [Pisciglobus halotolerans]|uniref:Type VII secretion protein EssB n=1 Tax=Pisciglobus halotolerans TaxID=745365 RepID=A0A1I3DA87_9LACT|nr:hypothetical protein [Pisciglobus halotolerans]SFH83647.1 hypothetical protein SAMN04489868_13216 [Pisciglobus halotolerans]